MAYLKRNLIVSSEGSLKLLYKLIYCSTVGEFLYFKVASLLFLNIVLPLLTKSALLFTLATCT